MEDLETLVANARAVCGIDLTRRTNDSPLPRKLAPNSFGQTETRLRCLAESNVIGVAVGDLNVGGSLGLDSQVGHGSHFHFTIQVKTTAAKEGGLQD